MTVMTTATTSTGRPVITAWSAVSPYGIGRAVFAEGLRERRGTVTELGPEHGSTPDGVGCVVPAFGIRDVLGKKGTRSMDRVTGLAVTAVGSLLDDADRNRAVGTGEGAAFALGTTTGSAQSMMDFTRDSLTGEQPFFVDPARFPNTVMNCAAGQSAIWYQLKGPNATIAGGRTAGLHALNYSRRLLGRAAPAPYCAAPPRSSRRPAPGWSTTAPTPAPRPHRCSARAAPCCSSNHTRPTTPTSPCSPNSSRWNSASSSTATPAPPSSPACARHCAGPASNPAGWPSSPGPEHPAARAEAKPTRCGRCSGSPPPST